MACIYRELKVMQHDAEVQAASDAREGGRARGALAVTVHDGEIFFTISDEDLSAACMARGPRFEIGAQACACGVSVFEELGLIRTYSPCGCSTVRAVHVCADAAKVELSDSVLYREGMGDIEEFARFREWAMRSPAEALRDRIVRPMLPDES